MKESLGERAARPPSDTTSLFRAGEADRGVRNVRQEGEGGGEEGAALMRGLHHLAAVLQQGVPDGGLEGAQAGVQDQPCVGGGGCAGHSVCSRRRPRVQLLTQAVVFSIEVSPSHVEFYCRIVLSFNPPGGPHSFESTV